MFTKVSRIFKLLYHIMMACGGLKHEMLNEKETVNLLKDKKLSFIRLGDGEAIVARGGGIYYQEKDSNLSNEINKIITVYNNKGIDMGFMLGLPRPYLQTSVWNLFVEKKYVVIWAHARYFFKRHTSPDKLYGDSFVFSKGQGLNYEILWKDYENVIFVHNDEIFSEQFKNKYNKNTFFVKVPKSNAYSVHKQIENNILDLFRAEELENDNTCILVSAGPGGKIIAFNLTAQGMVVFDTGHCWDYPLSKPINKDEGL